MYLGSSSPPYLSSSASNFLASNRCIVFQASNCYSNIFIVGQWNICSIVLEEWIGCANSCCFIFAVFQPDGKVFPSYIKYALVIRHQITALVLVCTGLQTFCKMPHLFMEFSSITSVGSLIKLFYISLLSSYYLFHPARVVVGAL